MKEFSQRESLPIERLTTERAIEDEAMQDVYRIRYAAYARVGYVDTGSCCELLDFYDDIPYAASHLARLDGTPVGTLRTIIDSEEFGLPMEDEDFGNRLRALRQQGRQLAEICKLAIVTQYRTHRQQTLMALQRAMLYHSLDQGIQDLVIAVIPTHAAYYEKVLLFERIGGVQRYHSLGCDALVLRLDLTTLEERYRSHVAASIDLHSFFFGEHWREHLRCRGTAVQATCRPSAEQNMIQCSRGETTSAAISLRR